MRTIILLTILAILPVTCKFYLFREFAADSDEARQAAQKLIDTEMLAEKNHDVDLYLSVYDKRVIIDNNGMTETYADLEKIIRHWIKDWPFHEIKLISAVIDGEYLKFEATRKKLKGSFTAVRSGSEFKIISGKIVSTYQKRRYLQEDVGEYIF